MEIVKSYITQNDCYRYNAARADSRYITFQDRGPIGLMLHSVGCAQPSGAEFARRWNKGGLEVSVHAFIDANDGKVWQIMPWNYRAWHCAGSGNNTHCGVEMCESAAISYTGSGANFVVKDKAKAQADCKRAYGTAVELFATLCRQYKLAPSAICSHKEGYGKGIASNHGDPEHYWRQLGMSYTMDGFRADVAKKIKEMEEPEMTEKEVKAYVATAINAAKTAWTQEVLASAKAQAKAEAEKEMEQKLGKYIAEIKDVPYSGLMEEVRELLDLEVINGGTPYGENPDDLGMPFNILRALIGAKRYMDKKVEGIKETA